MIRKIFAGALALVAASCALSPSYAGNLAVKDANSATQYLCEKTASDGSLIACHAILDTTGTQIDPATKQLQQSEISILSGMGTSSAPFTVVVGAGGLGGSSSNPLYVTGISGGSGAGGAVTAISGAYAAGAIVDLGTGPTPAANTVNARLATINTTLGTPAQAGGKIDTVITGTATDIGVSIAANTATQLVAATATRRGFSIQNQTSGACYLNGTATATADYHSMLIAAGTTYESKDSHVGTGALSLICTSAGGIYARQW